MGRDIHVEIEVLGKFFRVDKRIKAGTTAEINREIGRFETDRGSFQAKVLVTVIEKDLLFNDVGSTSGSIKINTSITKPQQFVFEVQAKENRSLLGKFWGKAIAVFKIILEAEASEAIKYVPDIDESQGFLTVKLEDNKSVESLPAYLKVKVERADAKREYFTILEGPYRGKLASVELKRSGSSWFITDVKHEPMIHAKYSISQKTFILRSKKYRTVDYPGGAMEKRVV